MEFDGEGILHVDPIQGTEHEIPADTVIFAVGQTPDIDSLSGILQIATTKKNTIVVNHETMQTGQPGVFAAGDAVSGPATFIEAIASGQKAAFFIDLYLRGRVLRRHYSFNPIKAYGIEFDIPQDIEKAERMKSPELPAAKRTSNFKEVILGFTSNMAIKEAKRCLNCMGALCKEVCPYNAPQFIVEENVKMSKCDLCLDRLEEGKQPICVAACPTRALDFGPMEELTAKYGNNRNIRGFTNSSRGLPSILFKQVPGESK
jgi:heterodisulfide reductase subunit A-like polyferredoxin